MNTTYRVDMLTLSSGQWVGTDVSDYESARRLIEQQPDTGHRFRIVVVTETTLWESNGRPLHDSP